MQNIREQVYYPQNKRYTLETINVIHFFVYLSIISRVKLGIEHFI